MSIPEAYTKRKGLILSASLGDGLSCDAKGSNDLKKKK
jgi:hypothetical protein